MKFKTINNSEEILDLKSFSNWQIFKLTEKKYLSNSSIKFTLIEKILVRYFYKKSNFEALLSYKTTRLN